jgi:hypothetical protein
LNCLNDVNRAAWKLLLPIICLEAYVGTRVLNIGFTEALQISGVGNLVSTLLGIPIAWMLLLLLQMIYPFGMNARGLDTLEKQIFSVTIQSPWLIPYMENIRWMEPAAAMVLCVPFFFMSVWVEYYSAALFSHGAFPGPKLLNFEWQANAISYGVIVCGLLSRLCKLALKYRAEELKHKSKPPNLTVIPPNLKVIDRAKPPDAS